ncbi:MAG: hypothetical protein ABSA21_11625 [Candidatus Limnocylindrales bacterium]
MARIKFVSVGDLVSPKPKERQPSPRQLAAMKRESEYEKAIAKLTSGKVAVFEPTDEKVSSLRTSLARVIARNERSSELHYAIKGGIGYVGLEPIPGARGGGRKKKA